MIKSLTITNQLGDSIKLELTKPEKSGFIVKSIDGLGPVKANINTSAAGASDGSFYNSARLDSRSIVMSLKFLQTGKETIEDVRIKSYKYFPIKRKISIMIETDSRKMQIAGYVEANEPNIFSNNEGCSITINCPDPYFYSLGEQTTVFNGIEPTFEFPFENDSLTEPLLEFGVVENKKEEVVYYEGDADTGVTIKIHALSEARQITIYNIGSDQEMRINTDKITVADGIYPQWDENSITKESLGDTGHYNYKTSYSNGDIVAFEGKAYMLVNTAVSGDRENFIPGGEKWTELAGPYPDWVSGTDYPEGAHVTHNGKLWIRIGHHGTETPAKNSSYWIDLTDKYPIYTMLAKDDIIINTRPGQKSVTLLRDGKTYNVLNCLDKGSKWFTLSKGDNVFAYEAEYGGTNLQFTMSNNIVYDGV